MPICACPRNPQAATQANACTAAGGFCDLRRDGFYVTSFAAVLAGVALYLYFRKALPRLEALPLDAWRWKHAVRAL